MIYKSNIIHIVCKNVKSLSPDNLVAFLESNGFQVMKISPKMAKNFKADSNQTVFLLGAGNAGSIVQDIAYKNQSYSGAISIMAKIPFKRRLFYKNRTLQSLKIPLMIIGGWNAVNQMQYHVNKVKFNECDLKKLMLTVYPDINHDNIFNISQDELLSFLHKYN